MWRGGVGRGWRSWVAWVRSGWEAALEMLRSRSSVLSLRVLQDDVLVEEVFQPVCLGQVCFRGKGYDPVSASKAPSYWVFYFKDRKGCLCALSMQGAIGCRCWSAYFCTLYHLYPECQWVPLQFTVMLYCAADGVGFCWQPCMGRMCPQSGGKWMVFGLC